MEFLPLTRRCVEQQTREDFRVVILDNASPPEAQRFFAEWMRTDSRVEVLRAEPRVAMFANFNRGLRATKTEFVTFFHDDDLYLPRFLEVLTGALEAHPGAAFAGSNYDFIDAGGATTEERRWITKGELWDGPRYAKELIGRGRNTVPMPGLVLRRTAFDVDGFDETLPIHFGDFVLLMRAAERGGMVVCAEPVIKIRRHADQASVALPLSESIALRTQVLQRYLVEFEDRWPDRRGLVSSLRRRTALLHRLGLFWGWLSAPAASERAACLAAMGRTLPDRATRRALAWVDESGVRPPDLAERLKRVAKRAAETLKL